MEQVDNDYTNYNIGADIMHQAEKPAIRDIIGDWLNALESKIRVGHIIKEQHDAGDDLNNKGYRGDKT